MAEYLNLKMFVHDRQIVKIYDFEDENNYLMHRSPKLFYIKNTLYNNWFCFKHLTFF